MNSATAFPLLFTIGVHAYSDGGRDAHHNPVPVYTPPLDQPGTPRRVCGWSAAGSSEPAPEGAPNRVDTDVILYAPTGLLGPHDVVDLPAGPAGQFEVIGYPADYDHGFHGWAPGLVQVRLRRIEGG